jgi:hypothetical protein
MRLDPVTATALEDWRRDNDDTTTAEAARKAIRAFLRSKGYIPPTVPSKMRKAAEGQGT